MAMKQIFCKLNTGASIPAMALGTWQSSKEEVGNAVRLAIELGYRHIDCAEIYGNEGEIGEALSEVLTEGKVKREELFVTSKLWCDSHHPDDVLPACQATLKNLQLDYLDLYLIHIPVAFKKGVRLPHSIAEGIIGYTPEGVQNTWQAMEGLVAKGLCKAIGVSNFSVKRLNKLLETASIVPACNQVELHPYLPQEKLKEFCDSKGILLTAYSPLGNPGRLVPKERLEREPKVMEEPVIKEIAAKHNCSVARVLLRWGIQRGYPVLPKSTSRDHLHDNFSALGLVLTDDEMAAIKSITTRQRYLTQGWMYAEGEYVDPFDGEID
ncbi:predicted protein [Nematostella vectensis]|uniref:NADP-dependent oxidoreductase domain-containing protein n=1 Tax=Nematostella vectensis TaxID=45351 RepID=A7SIT3_NEMVE|nr:aldo/keto reductase slr0942 [Nematostella vectensis]EDO36411.1 predicted protein [Nematostella vectensis]|eukprot:XP_001628474.1 predicted protein [Nematostella vectensis]